MRCIRKIGTLWILIILLIFTGCTSAKKEPPSITPTREKKIEEKAPQNKGGLLKDKGQPEEDIQKPSLPKALKATEGQEPTIRVYIKDEGDIKEMKFEDYIKNVVAGEIKNDWPPEAIEAQAIIARTFVLNFIHEKDHSKYGDAHISTDIEEAQAWNPEALNERITAAVEKTRGQAMIHGDKFAQGWFHSNAAGKTATSKEGLDYKKENPSYIKTVESPDDSPEIPEEDKNWEYKAPKGKVLEALEKMGKTPGDINKVSIGKKGPSGRATTLDFDGTQVSAPDFRIALGSTEMKSTLLDKVEAQGDHILFKGRGYGHGVGMSQWGAYKMAKDGKKSKDIIDHYFEGVEIVKMWD